MPTSPYPRSLVLPAGELALQESVFVVLDGRLVELADQVGSPLLFRVVEHNGRDLEGVNLEVLQPFGVACGIDPGVEDWPGVRLFVQGLQDLDVRLCVLLFVVLTL